MRTFLMILAALAATPLAAQEEGMSFDVGDVLEDLPQEDWERVDAEVDTLSTQLLDGQITFAEFVDRISDEAYAMWLRDGYDPADFTERRPNACVDGRDFVTFAVGGDLAGDDWRITWTGGATVVSGVAVPDDFIPPEMPGRLVPTRRGWDFYPAARKVPSRMVWATPETHDLQGLIGTGFFDAPGRAQEIAVVTDCDLSQMATLVGVFEDPDGRTDTMVLWVDSPELIYGVSMSEVGPATSVGRFQMSR